MKLSLLDKNVNTSSHIKGNLMALTGSLSVPVLTKSEIYAQQIIITQAGTKKLGLSDASFRVIRGRVHRVSLYIKQLNYPVLLGLVTTPELHYFVWAQNSRSVHPPTEEGYFRKLSDSYKAFLDLCSASSHSNNVRIKLIFRDVCEVLS